MFNTIAEIKSSFDQDVARRWRAGLSKNQAIFAASLQILRDIKQGEIGKEEGVKLVATELAHLGISQKEAASHIERYLTGEATSLPPLNMYAGYLNNGDGSFIAPKGERYPTASTTRKKA